MDYSNRLFTYKVGLSFLFKRKFLHLEGLFLSHPNVLITKSIRLDPKAMHCLYWVRFSEHKITKFIYYVLILKKRWIRSTIQTSKRIKKHYQNDKQRRVRIMKSWLFSTQVQVYWANLLPFMPQLIPPKKFIPNVSSICNMS